MSRSLNQRSRAYIRHQKFRIRRKCREIAKKWVFWSNSGEERNQLIEKEARKMEKPHVNYYDITHYGNPRRIRGRNKRTLREKCAEIEENEQKTELFGTKLEKNLLDEQVGID